MAIFAISNPKKNLTVDLPIEQVKKGVKNVYLINNKFKFTSSNEVFNQYTFEILEFLSLGVYIDINLSSINENKTEIIIEVRRKIGVFDQNHEVTKANNHIQLFIENLSKSIVLTDLEINQLELESKESSNEVTNAKKSNISQIVLIVLILLIIIFSVVAIYWVRHNR